jgi:hypothetical protein
MAKHRKRFLLVVVVLLAGLGGSIYSAAADKIKHSIAVFSGLDKITGRIISFEVATNETVQFGTLQITERVCYTRPPTEAPQTDTFVEVDEVGTDNRTKRIFTGWMFAASPGLHALDHPVYDIWLTGCKGDQQVIASPPSSATAQPAPVAAPQQPAQAAPPALRRTETEGGSQQPNGPIEVGPPPGFIPPGTPSASPGPQSVPPSSAPGDDGL